jgi:hypothetical protein
MAATQGLRILFTSGDVIAALRDGGGDWCDEAAPSGQESFGAPQNGHAGRLSSK